MQITVNGQHIAIVDDTLVSNSVNIYECEFEFDASWDGFAKTSVWQLNSDEPIEVVIDGGVAVIPHEVLENAGILRIGVYGTKDEKVMPTVWLEKRKVCLGTPTGSIGTEPTPSIYAQILAVATEAKDIAEDVQTEWESVSATAETLPSGSSATASFDDGVFSFGIPQGQQGERGETGAQGEDGFSPIVTVTSIVGGHQITITDAEGAHIFAVMDGVQGEQGETGVGIATITQNADYSLTITLTNGTTYTTTSLRGETGATGATPDFSIGTVTTLEPNESATATITGTAEEPVLNLGIPKGVKGDTGEVSEAELEEALIDKADVILNSASGSIASFDDGAEMPVKSLEVEINAVQSGSGDPSPTNVRPISGWDAVNVTRTGKNLWNANDIVLSENSGITINNANAITIKQKPNQDTLNKWYVPEGGGVISFHVKTVSLTNASASLKLFASGHGNVAIPLTSVGYEQNISFIVANGTERLMFGGWQYSGIVDITNIQFEPNTSTATAYEPYNGTTYPISLGDTYYGGVLDVTSGVLSVNDVIGTYDGDETVTIIVTTSTKRVFTLPAPNALSVTNTDTAVRVLCDTFKPSSANNVINLSSETNEIALMSSNRLAVSFDPSYTVATFKEWLVEHPINVVYPLATPQTITLTPTEVSTVLGYNNIFADSGNVEVTYRADTKKYIDGTIVDVPLAMIAPIESGTKSSKAYAVGEYFILNGNQFCKAKTSIASGATFTLNTNYTITTIGAELKALA